MSAAEYLRHSIQCRKTVGVVGGNGLEGYVEIAEPLGVDDERFTLSGPDGLEEQCTTVNPRDPLVSELKEPYRQANYGKQPLTFPPHADIFCAGGLSRFSVRSRRAQCFLSCPAPVDLMTLITIFLILAALKELIKYIKK